LAITFWVLENKLYLVRISVSNEVNEMASDLFSKIIIRQKRWFDNCRKLNKVNN